MFAYQDLSPKYASALLGMTNVAASIPGIVGVAAVGALFEATHSWELSLFLPSAAFMVAGAGIFTFAGSHEQVDYDAADNSPFAWEACLQPLQCSMSQLRRVMSNVTALLLPNSDSDRARGQITVPISSAVSSRTLIK